MPASLAGPPTLLGQLRGAPLTPAYDCTDEYKYGEGQAPALTPTTTDKAKVRSQKVRAYQFPINTQYL